MQELVLQNESWSRIRPLGMNCELIDRTVLPGGVIELVKLLFYHNKINKSFEIELAIPKFYDNVIFWRNSKKALMCMSQVEADSDFDIAINNRPQEERMTLHIITPNEVAIRKISDHISHAIRNWFYGSEEQVDPQSVQISIDKWFSNGEEWRVLKYSKIAQEDQNNGIIIASEGPHRTHDERLISKLYNPKLWNMIDINSTSFSDKVNTSFRFVSGAKTTKTGVIKASDKAAPFCNVIKKHGIALDKNAKRIYLLRNTFEASIDVSDSIEPIVSPYRGNDLMLSGVDLLTAVMHLKHFTHEDGIAISESAAKKMFGSKIITQLIESDLAVTPKVKIGDDVYPDSIVAVDGEKPVCASKIYVHSKIEEISVSKGKRFGIETNRVWIKYRSYYPLETGDKMSNRHGGKGVVSIIPDNDMPICLETGEKIEICIAPESIINRKSMSAFWEMMLTRKAYIDNGNNWNNVKTIKVQNFDTDAGTWPSGDLYDFKSLSKLYGNKMTLAINGISLEHQTFFSKMFWLRLDKIALEIVSSVRNKRPKNSFGAFVDNAKVSGQRCNAAKLLTMTARNMDPLIADVIEGNMSGKVFFRTLVDCVKNSKYVCER